MKANIGELDIPPGWRTLGGDEHVEPNDEMRLDDGTWRRASLASLGKAKLRHETYRRNINIAGEGWRLLEPTELTTEGDETKVNGNWREIDPSECGYPAHSPLGATYYRRRTECRPTDAEAETPQPDVGEGWRWVEPSEILRAGDEYYGVNCGFVETGAWGYPANHEGNVYNSRYRRCVTPDSKPVEIVGNRSDVGEGWRPVRTGERLEAGDQFADGSNADKSDCVTGEWEPVYGFAVGGFGNSHNRYRRRVTPDSKPVEIAGDKPDVGEGWRLIEIGEVIEAGDELSMLPNGAPWIRAIHTVGQVRNAAWNSIYRRRVKPVTTLKTKTICVCSKCNKDITDENEGFIVDGGIYLANPNEMMGLLGPTGKHAYCRPCFCGILKIGCGEVRSVQN